MSNEKCSTNLNISDITCEKELETQIKYSIDSLLSRLVAKNLFNYLCYEYGKEFVLNKEYDNIRNFIRNGTFETPLTMCVNNRGLSGIPNRVDNSHAIGTAWTVTDKLCLVGFVSWFNSITYWGSRRMFYQWWKRHHPPKQTQQFSSKKSENKTEENSIGYAVVAVIVLVIFYCQQYHVSFPSAKSPYTLAKSEFFPHVRCCSPQA